MTLSEGHESNSSSESGAYPPPPAVVYFSVGGRRVGVTQHTLSYIAGYEAARNEEGRMIRRISTKDLTDQIVRATGIPEGDLYRTEWSYKLPLSGRTVTTTYIPGRTNQQVISSDRKVAPMPKSPHWWASDPEEKYWIEIRWAEGIGLELRCPVADAAGHANAWYDLVEDVAIGDVVFHWNAVEHRFVGRSEVAGPVSVSSGTRTVKLHNFTPIRAGIDLSVVRSLATQIESIRDELREQHGEPLYLPFQFRSDGLRLMSNYFAKLPSTCATLLFDETGLGESSAPSDSGDEQFNGDSETPVPDSRFGFLSPFQAKRDSWYVANVAGGVQRRSRSHETLVNRFAEWLSDHGISGLGRNAAIDLGLASPPVIIEAKTIPPNSSGWSSAIRAAVGQLYEYRYFQVVDPMSQLMILVPEVMPEKWLTYLETDRGIGAAWATGQLFELSPLAVEILGI